MRRNLIFIMLVLAPGVAVAKSPGDPTNLALERCLKQPDHVSTAAQVACEGQAAKIYDQRMNAAYGTLMRLLRPVAAQRLRQAQRAWIAFRDNERAARNALYATRLGAIYVPMQADDDVQLIRDRALQLEGYVRILRVR